MSGSRSAKDFFRPLAVGAPTPLTEIPARPSRAIHFFDPSNAKMAAKVPDMVGKVDVLLGNLEDAIKADNKVAAREGLVEIAQDTDGLRGPKTQLWTRINALDSPWVLDDLTTLVPAIGDKLDVIMVPEGAGRRGHPLRRPACSPSSRPRPGWSGRSWCTRSSRPRAAWPTSRRSAAPARACRASPSARPTSPRTAG